ncbi:MAG: hypothetical protein WD042_16780 [Phycisphaeraceae bacterium]
MRIHESWREEIGWFMAVLGVAGVLFALGEMLIRAFSVRFDGTWWVALVAAAVIALVGMVLHATRPSKRLDQGERPASQVQSSSTGTPHHV